MNKIKKILKYGILAPSGYNIQPWKFKIISKKLIEVWVDLNNKLKTIDPSAREIYISSGTVLTNIEVAAKHFGYFVKVIKEKSVTINNKLDKIAEIRLIKKRDTDTDTRNEKLFIAIKKRQTNRRPFEEITIDSKEMEKQFNKTGSVGLKIYTDNNIKIKIGNLIAQASSYWGSKESFRRELMRWLRQDIDGKDDGVWQNYWKSSNKSYTIDNVLEKAILDETMAVNSSALIVIWSKNDDKENWIETGRFLEKILLILTDLKIQHSYFNSIVESDKHRNELGKQLGKNMIPQLVLRLGKAKRVRKSRRKKLNNLLI